MNQYQLKGTKLIDSTYLEVANQTNYYYYYFIVVTTTITNMYTYIYII